MKSLLLLLCAAFGAIVVCTAGAATPPAKAKAKAEQAPSLREVEYTSLENQVGKQITVHTTNGTARSGTLIKYTNVNLTVRLGPEAGSIDLTLPRNTVRKAFLAVGAADPLFPNETFKQEAKAGAQKN